MVIYYLIMIYLFIDKLRFLVSIRYYLDANKINSSKSFVKFKKIIH